MPSSPHQYLEVILQDKIITVSKLVCAVVSKHKSCDEKETHGSAVHACGNADEMRFSCITVAFVSRDFFYRATSWDASSIEIRF
jgi:hypothetical protein